MNRTGLKKNKYRNRFSKKEKRTRFLKGLCTHYAGAEYCQLL
jgi:alanine racemase